MKEPFGSTPGSFFFFYFTLYSSRQHPLSPPSPSHQISSIFFFSAKSSSFLSHHQKPKENFALLNDSSSLELLSSTRNQTWQIIKARQNQFSIKTTQSSRHSHKTSSKSSTIFLKREIFRHFLRTGPAKFSSNLRNHHPGKNALVVS